MPAAPDIAATITGIVRADRGRLLAALIAGLRDFQLAEDCLQEALAAALDHWGRSGVPASPQGWLLRVARRKAIDRLRRAARWRDRADDLALLIEADQAASAEPPPEIPDERLRLIFTCCHPALGPKSRVALTLRTLGGLTTTEIARAFLDRDETMGQRLSRAKAKIARAGIPFAVPGPEAWSERVNSVLTVVYLIFNEGYGATAGDNPLRLELCEEAIWLGRMLAGLLPEDAEALGLLSLMLTTHARREARFDRRGAMISLEDQDRTLWSGALIAEGLRLIDLAMGLRAPGPFQIKAAISALHAQAARYRDTDWRQMVLLYDSLSVYEPTPVVRLNRAVALMEAGAAAAALAELDAIAGDLDNYQPYHAARAAILLRSGHETAAQAAFDRAIEMAGTAAERDFLIARRAEAKKKAETKLGQSPTGR
ncbi:MAG: sigma-70 family RNA polymerase sigma factor [Rhodobacteraceae bacterium]|nr:sigma-70 family RNA polymerase sigma factor [Paracoccaceae bacterium]